MFRPNEPFRREVIYDGPETNGKVPVMVLAQAQDDDDGNERWRVRLPESGKALLVFADDLTPFPDAHETMDERFQRFTSGFTSPLVAPFVLEAIERYAADVLQDEAETMRQMNSTMVSGAAWIEAAKQAKTIADLKQ